MTCAWTELLRVLPVWLQLQIDPYATELQELRMRINSPPELVIQEDKRWLTRRVQQEDIDFCINAASQYSPWTATTMRQGFLTIKGGHRIGLCGDAIIKNGDFAGYRSIHSMCIRVARDIPFSQDISPWENQSILIIGPPGWGKTTLLRNISRSLSTQHHVCVIDERQELFPPGFTAGRQLDILSGCPKAVGIEIMIRTMGPEIIAVDEITSAEDVSAFLFAANCGVKLLATAHAGDVDEFYQRKIYKELWLHPIFDTILLLHSDKSFQREAMVCPSNGLALH